MNRKLRVQVVKYFIVAIAALMSILIVSHNLFSTEEYIYFEVPLENITGGAGETVGMGLKVTEQSEICTCWAYQGCSHGASPPEGAFSVWIFQDEMRSQTLNYRSTISDGATFVDLNGINACVSIAAGASSQFRLFPRSSRLFDVNIVARLQ